jgi:SAM-dependent methyltransferase
MTDDWQRQTRSVASSFTTVADVYRATFADELARKPFDRAFLERVARRRPRLPVLEVGAGPGHIGAYLAARGVDVLTSDASIGQLREARALLGPDAPIVAADLARLPVRPGALDGVLAFYCLIFGPAPQLDAVFRDWRAALAPGGFAAIAVHAGEGVSHAAEWHGRAVDFTLVLRDPDDLQRRLEAAGFTIDSCVVREPYDDERTPRCYVVAVA